MATIHVHPSASLAKIASLAKRMNLTPAQENGRVVLHTEHPAPPVQTNTNIIRIPRRRNQLGPAHKPDGPDEAA